MPIRFGLGRTIMDGGFFEGRFRSVLKPRSLRGVCPIAMADGVIDLIDHSSANHCLPCGSEPAPTGGYGVWLNPGQKKAPRPNETRGKELVGCGQPKELFDTVTCWRPCPVPSRRPGLCIWRRCRDTDRL